jgi:predicted enzyme related to lactoylglutathione lyase
MCGVFSTRRIHVFINVCMLRVTEVAFVCYPVTDMARARAFYEGVLGFSPGSVWEHSGAAWVEYEIGPHTIAISNMAAEQWKPSANGPAAALEVENFDASIELLKSEGVRFAYEPFASPICRTAIILDPDGNSLGIHRRNEGR